MCQGEALFGIGFARLSTEKIVSLVGDDSCPVVIGDPGRLLGEGVRCYHDNVVSIHFAKAVGAFFRRR